MTAVERPKLGKVKCLPLWQPWASLVAIGAKRVETRHWPAPTYVLGERIAIHATKTQEHLYMVESEPFLRRLREGQKAGKLAIIDGELPLGSVIATAVLSRCTAITFESAAALRERNPDEFAFGNYDLTMGHHDGVIREQRYAWVLDDVEPLAHPFPFRGSQGIFDVPDHLLGRAAAQGSLL